MNSRSLSPTLSEELIDRLYRLIKRLNEKNHGKFITQSLILDMAITTSKKIPENKTEMLEGGAKKNKGFSIDGKNFNILEKSSLGVSRAVMEILKEEVLLYEKIEELAENAIIGHDDKKYFVLVDALPPLPDGCLGKNKSNTLMIRGEALMHATYEDIFTAILLSYKDCHKNGADSAK
jgi:hypothetical protein